MRSTVLKSLWVLPFLFVHLQLNARQPSATDSISRRYAQLPPTVPDIKNRQHSGLYLVKFRAYPGAAVLHQQGNIKALTRFHYILQLPVTDTTLLHQVVYMYTANDNWKSSERLLQQLEQRRDADSLVVQATLDTTRGRPSYCRIQRSTGRAFITALVKKQDWPRFIAQPAIRFADALRIARPEIVINTGDMTLNRIGFAQQQYPQLQGRNMVVSLKEDLFDTTDADLKDRYVPSGLASARTSAHATIMATLIAGAGNTAPAGRGVAVQARLSSSNFDSSLLPDDDAVYQQLGIRTQNHSYGTGIENYYGTEAAAYDQQTYTTDTLLHVFSSGNNGDEAPSDGTYSGIKGFANLSGTFKQAKNVLVAGGTDGANNIPVLSAKGPAYDGRVKPEIVAYGEDGTSGAAALTSGVVTLVQEAYINRHGQCPSAALTRTVLINSADDTGPPQVDRSSGFGALNAFKAIRTIQEQRYTNGAVADGGRRYFSITVPAGMQRLKVTLGWNDPPAAVNTPKALVNDLDLWVTDATGRRYDPWVLSVFPHADSLKAPARRGKDTLNNIEQVTVDNPAGEIRIYVNGSHIRNGTQPYFIAYEYTPARYFNWQSPAPGAMLGAGSTVPLRWETNRSGNGSLSYSLDSGATWQLLAPDQPLAAGLYNWQVPNAFTSALLRMETADTIYTSAPFFISRPPDIGTGFDCTDSALLHWPPQQEAGAYEVYALNGPYLQTYARTSDTFMVIPKRTVSATWFAVSAVHTAGWTGIKSYAMDYGSQGLQCYVQSLLADATDNGQVRLSLTLGSLYNLKTLWWERRGPGGYIPLQSVPVTNGNTYTYLDTEPGEGIIQYRVRLETTAGGTLYSDTVSVALAGRNNFVLFPNPASDNLRLLSRDPRPRKVRITDMNGRLTGVYNIVNTQENIPVAQLARGMYILTVYEEGRKVFARKFVKL